MGQYITLLSHDRWKFRYRETLREFKKKESVNKHRSSGTCEKTLLKFLLQCTWLPWEGLKHIFQLKKIPVYPRHRMEYRKVSRPIWWTAMVLSSIFHIKENQFLTGLSQKSPYSFEPLEQTETPLQFLCKSKKQDGHFYHLESKSFCISKWFRNCNKLVLSTNKHISFWRFKDSKWKEWL